jgi:signal transduction histidine kinase/ligand-binding sensor domain-containing protein
MLAWMLLLWSSSALALNPALDISQYAHTAWRIRDGFAKGSISAIAQTLDGYLWLGTEEGLFRFDGVRAVPWQWPDQHLPSERVTSLLAASNGSLWIGTDKGLASSKDRQLTQYPALGGRAIGRLVEDREHSLWLVTYHLAVNRWSLCTVRRADVECYGDDGGPGSDAIGLYQDSGGVLWVGTFSGVWRWKPGPPAFVALRAPANGVQGFAEGEAGALLLLLNDGLARLVGREPRLIHPLPPSLQANRLLRDRDGALWIGNGSSGLLHLHAGTLDVFGEADGLSSNRTTALFEDREGNIWVATYDGLDRFRATVAAAVSTKQGLLDVRAQSVAAARNGGVWVGTSSGVNRLRDNRATPSHVGGFVSSILEDRSGRLWIAVDLGVGYLAGDRFVPVRGVPAGLTRAIVEDSQGVWIVKPRDGVFRLSREGRVLEQIRWASLQHSDAAVAAAADAREPGLWLGFAAGGVTHFVDGVIREVYGSSNGLGNGAARHLRVEADGTVWAATDGGLSRIKNGRVSTLTSRNGLPCDEIHWTVEDDVGSFWVHTRCGLARLASAEVNAWISAADSHGAAPPMVRATLFDRTDGVRVFPNPVYYSSPAAKSLDGRLWLASLADAAVIDPRHIPRNDIPPPLNVEQIVADGTTHEVGSSGNGHLRLPPLVRDLRIDYTALSYVAPEKVRFRYKLEGYDRDWQEVGNRRQAFYTNLPPRSYRFRVLAANNSGVWNEAGAAVDFSIAPAYYQTTWFLALSVASVVALVWIGYRVRVRIVERHEREITALNERLMKAQEQERIRIAGELHDGVMQEMLAATMLLGTAKRRIPDELEAKAKIEHVQEMLIKVGTDIRQLSHDLHPPMLQEAGLPNAVRSYCEQFSGTSGLAVSCDADERVKDLSRGASLALFRIVQEALGNAAKHAKARQVAIRLTRMNGEVSLTVSDDGVGFEPGRLGTAGGLGLVMMRERATQLDGTFDFSSEPGRGTSVRVVIPFR